MPASTGGSQEFQPPAASLRSPPKPVPATSLCPQAAFLKRFQLRIQSLPHPSRDPAPIFHHKTPFWLSPLLVAPSLSSCTGCSQDTALFWGRVKQLQPAKPQGEYFGAISLSNQLSKTGTGQNAKHSEAQPVPSTHSLTFMVGKPVIPKSEHTCWLSSSAQSMAARITAGLHSAGTEDEVSRAQHPHGPRNHPSPHECLQRQEGSSGTEILLSKNHCLPLTRGSPVGEILLSQNHCLPRTGQ